MTDVVVITWVTGSVVLVVVPPAAKIPVVSVQLVTFAGTVANSFVAVVVTEVGGLY